MFGLFSWFVLGIIFAPAGVILGILSLNIDKNKVPVAIGLAISVISLIVLLIALSILL